MSSSIIRAAPIVFPATARHTATVIFAHGLGDTGHGWAGAVQSWRSHGRLDGVKFILPHAPAIPITCNWGMKMPGWYDIHTIDGNVESLRRNEDEKGILESQAYFHELIQKEVDSGVQVVVGGFSQGGAMSIFSGLTAKVKLAGIVALSSYVPLSVKFAELVPKPEFNKETPIFMGHGDADTVVPTPLGKLSYDLLKSLGYNATFKIYKGMPHLPFPEELDDVEAFLVERLQASEDNEGKSEL
ncbi:acyl-protein thioesterase [Achaetomium macrosporum]|uniref:Acyl-protein thioesterase 1 n=1 Tax=Achaetomium macrosporum TaxID=79813 RepID=A0AAN7CJK3_9PEZI|nr:acyl-protein thioesterase [Achaetomium macrosporum]